jgi:uncharacterized protein YqgQ
MLFSLFCLITFVGLFFIDISKTTENWNSILQSLWLDRTLQKIVWLRCKLMVKHQKQKIVWLRCKLMVKYQKQKIGWLRCKLMVKH